MPRRPGTDGTQDATGFPAPALGLVELSSIARGIGVCDAMVKRALVKVLAARPASPGKYLVLVNGGVAEVGEAMEAGCAHAKEALLDRLFLPQAHRELTLALEREPRDHPLDALAVIELATVAATLLSADAAVKTAAVRLRTLRLADGIGGKGYYTLTGSQADVEAAVEAAIAAAGPGRVVSTEIIPRPHADIPRGSL
jgi:microcompartment protein CcmL/EutN